MVAKVETRKCVRCGHDREQHCCCGAHCLHHDGKLVEIAKPLKKGGKPCMGYMIDCKCAGFA